MLLACSVTFNNTAYSFFGSLSSLGIPLHSTPLAFLRFLWSFFYLCITRILFLCPYCIHWCSPGSCPWPSFQFVCSFWMISPLLWLRPWLMLGWVPTLSWRYKYHISLMGNRLMHDFLLYISTGCPRGSYAHPSLNLSHSLPPPPNLLLLLLYSSFAWVYHLSDSPQPEMWDSFLIPLFPSHPTSCKSPSPVGQLLKYHFVLIFVFLLTTPCRPLFGGWISASFLTGLFPNLCLLPSPRYLSSMARMST